MDNLSKAIEVFRDKGASCVLCKDDTLYMSYDSGISPMMGYIASQTDLKGFSAADKIVGRAAAMLFILAGVKEIYADVMSRSAIDLLKAHGIVYSYEVITESIINRRGDGMCPMEEAVLTVAYPKEAYAVLKERLERIKR